MARKRACVLLGFEDECIVDKHKSLVNFTTNKIGGKPDWPLEGIPHPVCKLCGLKLPLVLQIYAPLEGNPYHRTLYLFGCINPNCWNQSESWTCIRSQCLEANMDQDTVSSSTLNMKGATDWCCEADDWEDDNNVNNIEENGNVIRANQTGSNCYSDDEDETESYEDDVNVQFGRMNVNECNANWDDTGIGAGAHEGGAVGQLLSPSATAEIEGEESEIVTIDTPTAPQHNLLALLQQVAPLPSELRGLCNEESPQFISSFISVGEEDMQGASTISPISEHVRELVQEYQQNNGEESSLHSPQHEKEHGDQLVSEKYEKSLPAHGDKLFHRFMLRVQKNPGQILRYCRDGGNPLLFYPEPNLPSRCQHCCGELVFELQVIPTLVTKLQLLGSQSECAGSHLEFGTVLVFTCRRSCWVSSDTFHEEAIIVQAEII